jgi:hypothetical protein
MMCASSSIDVRALPVGQSPTVMDISAHSSQQSGFHSFQALTIAPPVLRWAPMLNSPGSRTIARLLGSATESTFVVHAGRRGIASRTRGFVQHDVYSGRASLNLMVEVLSPRPAQTPIG